MHPGPRYNHPFSLQEAMQFEPGTITTEIARLQNSLQHLTSTQSVLEEHIATDPDPDLIQVLEENRVVIASQTERIEILRQALDKQGVVSASNTHYDLPTSAPLAIQPSRIYPTTQAVDDPPQPRSEEDEDRGVYL